MISLNSLLFQTSFKSFDNVRTALPDYWNKIKPLRERITRKFRRLKRKFKEGDCVKAGSILVIQTWITKKYFPGYYVKYGPRGCLVSTVKGKVHYTKEPIESHLSLKNSDSRYINKMHIFLHVIPNPIPIPLHLIGFRTKDSNENIIIEHL